MRKIHGLSSEDALACVLSNIPSRQRAGRTSNQNELTQTTEDHPVQHSGPLYPVPDADLNTSENIYFDASTIGEGSVPAEVIKYYEYYNDESSHLFPNIPKLNPAIENLDGSAKILFDYVYKGVYSQNELEGLFSLVHNCMDKRGKESIQQFFKDSKSFAKYVSVARKWEVVKDGWRRANINMESGMNSSGVFRCPLALAKTMIDELGGASELTQFQEKFVNNKRVYSTMCDSDTMRDYRTEVNGSIVAAISIYCDGAVLSNSGTQSMYALRIQLSNLKKTKRKWMDIGYAPTMTKVAKSLSTGKAKEERAELFQRFLFVVLKNLINASHSGFVTKEAIVFPLLTMVIADQPQERTFFALKYSQSYKDCSICLAPTDLRPKKKHGKKKKSDCSEPETQEESDTNYEMDVKSIDEAELLKELFEKAPLRDVTRTVRAQLRVAIVNRSSSKYDANRVKADKRFLHLTSAKEYPPVLAAFRGLGSWPYRLYKSIGFDSLHTLSLGPFRDLPETAFRAIRSSLKSYKMRSAPAVISIMNDRLAMLPRDARITRFRPFLTSERDVSAGVSGKMRRDCLPFLWVTFMGLMQTKNPDDDPLLSVALSLDLLLRKVRSINLPLDNAYRTEDDIKELETLCLQLGKMMEEHMGERVKTKLHRIAFHVGDHLRSFGCSRSGDTDENEEAHKLGKAGYIATNQRLEQIAPQILYVTYGSIMDRFKSKTTKSNEDNFFYRSSFIDDDDDCDIECTEIKDALTEIDIVEDTSYILDEVLNWNSILNSKKLTIEEMELAVTRLNAEQNKSSPWKKQKKAFFTSSLPWCGNSGRSFRQVVCAGDMVYGFKNRRDGIIFTYCGQTCYGRIHCFYSKGESKNKGTTVALVRKLEPAELEVGNQKVGDVYGHGRYKYSYREGYKDITLLSVPISSFIRSVLLVPDPWQVVRQYGAKQSLNSIPDTPETRRSLCFFEVLGYSLSSVAYR